MSIPVFFIEPTDRIRVYLRRYCSATRCACPSRYGYHHAMVYIGDELSTGQAVGDTHDHSDIRWPLKCEGCDYEFVEGDQWQRFVRNIYRMPNGEECTLEDAPVGACWNADWLADGRREGFYAGPDGRCLIVRTPGGDWTLDARANNCTMPGDNKHKCWVRHGRPEDGTLHVDKNGLTCAAGGGSIIVGSYHGFLHNGKLVKC